MKPLVRKHPIIVDAHSLVMPCILGSAPEEIRLHLPFTGGVYGALNSLRYVLARPEVKAGRVFMCFDHSPPDRRRTLIPGYKERKDDDCKPFESPEQKADAYEQLWVVWSLLRLLGVTCLRYNKREGDDVVGAVAQLQLASGAEPIVVTGDSDLWQVVGWGARVWDLRHSEMISAVNFPYRAQASTDCYLLYRALVGGKDGVTGARGIGPAKAALLLERAHWYLRLHKDPVQQLGSLCEFLGRQPRRSKAEVRLLLDRRRLERTIRGLDLRTSFGPPHAMAALGERLKRRPRADAKSFLRRCRDLGLRGVLQHPQRFVTPFVGKDWMSH